MWSLEPEGIDAVRGVAGAVDLQVHMIRHGLETDQPALAYRALARARELLALGALPTPNYDPELQVALAAARLHAREGEFHLADAALRSAEVHVLGATPEAAWYAAEAQGVVAELAGDADMARTAFARCAELAAEIDDPDLLRQSRVRLAAALLATGDCAGAAALAEQDHDAPEYWTRLNSRLLAGMADACAGRPQEALQAYAAAESLLAPGAPADFAARLGLEQSRALTAMGQRREAFAALRRVRASLAGADSRNTTDVGAAFNRGIVRETAEAMIGLLHDEPGLVGRGEALATARELAAWAGGRAIVPAQGPRLEFFVGRDRSFGWVLSADRADQQWWELLPAGDLPALIEAVTTDLGYPGREIDDAALARLGEALLGPLAGRWSRDEVLEIVPDGALGALPWAALPWRGLGGEAMRPALEQGPLVLLVGAGRARTTAPDAREGALVIGADDAGIEAGGRLHYAEAEAKAVAALLSAEPVELLLGSTDAPADLLAAMGKSCRTIHLASHAQVYEGADGHSAIHISGVGGSP